MKDSVMKCLKCSYQIDLYFGIFQADNGYLYGFVYFRQTKDKSIKRGYFQKVHIWYICIKHLAISATYMHIKRPSLKSDLGIFSRFLCTCYKFHILRWSFWPLRGVPFDLSVVFIVVSGACFTPSFCGIIQPVSGYHCPRVLW